MKKNIIQLIAILMCVSGAFSVYTGASLVAHTIFGLISLAIGGLSLYYGFLLFQMKKKAYVGAMVLAAIGVAISLVSHLLWGAVLDAVVLYILYTYRGELVN
jgi:hypothetical protein